MAITYSITGGADGAKFAINANTGALTFKEAPDFEKPGDADEDNVYEVEVGATDPDGTTKQLVKVTITDVKEGGSPPEITSGSSKSIPENTTAVMTVTATDPDDEEGGGGEVPAVWVPCANGSKVQVAGFDWEVESGPNAVFRFGNAFKMIWRYGESWPEDISSGSEGRRAEIDGYRKVMNAGQTWWAAYSMSLDDGPDWTATWLFCRQYHACYNYELHKGSKSIRFALQASNPVGSIPVERGKIYHCVDKIIIGQSAETWVNGESMGRTGRPEAGHYPKFGLYGEKVDRTTQTIRYDNIEFGQDDLSARITTPKPNTQGWLT
jgi:hypothetical protein